MTLDANHINSCIARALKGESYLDSAVLDIAGFSTKTMRHLFSNLCHSEGAAYLEIGVFKGASFIAAFNNNEIHAIGIDDFSQDFSQGDIRTQLKANLQRWASTSNSGGFIEADCFAWAKSPDKAAIRQPFDIFTYDGEHSRTAQARALPAFFDLLADRFIFIVDDTNWVSVAEGTVDGFNALDGRVRIEQKWVLQGQRRQDDKIWHNGVCLYLCEKIK